MISPSRLAVVTGASSGIGAELAMGLAARGYHVFATARRADRLHDLRLRIAAAGGECTALPADLADYAQRERLIAALAPNADDVEVLINNAGFGTHGFFTDTDLDRELILIDVNCAAVVHLTKRVLPWMIARKRGYILNMASVAAFQPGPVMAMYYASKAFVLSFSEALSEECDGTGVVVSALCPGTIRTEFQAAAGIASSAPAAYASKMSASDVAEIGLDAMFAGKRVVVPAARNRVANFVNRFLPRRTVVSAVRRIQEARLPQGHGSRVKGQGDRA
ncbi:MAG: SDR family oxidoreductase [Gemmatimonadota bacterium]